MAELIPVNMGIFKAGDRLWEKRAEKEPVDLAAPSRGWEQKLDCGCIKRRVFFKQTYVKNKLLKHELMKHLLAFS